MLNLPLLIALATSPIAALYWSLESVVAQSPSASPISPPTAVPAGSIVRIDGSNSLLVVNQSLKQRYEKESPGTQVDVGSNGSEAALQALLDGKVDIAAIGRPLTAAEKQKGLVPVSIGREKIAIITSSKNPYSGNVTFEQFAKIFRGEIANWSQLGGTSGKIRFVDRPETSDTRQAFKSYPVFKAAPFKAGATATAVSQDSTADVIQKLGKDGMGYAAYSQVKGVDGVKIISMHKTLPDNPAYPFSKPRYFVTKGAPSAASKDFLTYATGASGLATIAAANQAEAAAIAPAVSPSTPVSPTVAPETATSPDATTSPSIVTSPSPEPAAIAPVPDATNRGLAGLIPWLLLVPAAILGWIWWSGRGRRSPAAPLPSADIERSPQPSVAEIPATPSIPAVASVPPVTPPLVPIPPVPPIVNAALTETFGEVASNLSGINPAIVGGAAIAAAGGLAALASNGKAEPAPPTLIEPSLDLPEPEAGSLMAPVSPESSVAFPVSVGQPDLNLGLAAGAALAAGAGVAWAKRSQDADLGQGAAIPAGIVSRIAALPVLDSRSLADVDDGLAPLPSGYGDSRIVLMPRDPQWAYAYWDASESHKAALRHQGGERLALRFYDVTDTELSQQNPHSLQQYDCEEIATDWYIPVPLSDRDYIVEIGYLANDGRWLMLARSAPIRIPPIYPSDLIEEQDVTIAWDEELNGKTFATPLTYEKKARTIHQTMYELAHAAAGDRVESSLHSSIQAARSDVFPSGVGMMSGVGMSGVGMSGVGMGLTASGVGMSGVGIGALTTSGVGMSGVGMSGVGIGALTASGVGMSGVGMSGAGMGGLTTSGVGMSGIGMSGVGIGGLTASGVGMSGVGMSGVGIGGLTASGVGMSGVGMSGVGIGGLTASGVGMSGVGMSGVGMGGLTASGVGMSGVGMSGVGMSGVGMLGVGMGGLTTSGVGMSGVGMSGIGMSGIGFFASMPPIRSRKFWLVADAELIIYGATEPDATLTIAGRPVKLNPDGTFRFQMSFQDGLLDFPILAVAVDGVQTRAIHLKFDRATPVRNTNTKDDAVEEWLPS